MNGILDTALPCSVLFLQTEDIKWCQKSSPTKDGTCCLNWTAISWTFCQISASICCLKRRAEARLLPMLAIWQTPRWQKQDGCFHGKNPCGMAASKPIAVTLLEKCAVLSRSEFFNVILSAQTDICHTCTFQMQMLQCPDTLYTLLSILESAKECVTGMCTIKLLEITQLRA